MKSTRAFQFLCLVIAIASQCALAQQSIAVSPIPFQDSSQLPIAPAKPAIEAVASVARVPIEHRLRTGEPIHTELKRWAEHDGWEFRWYHAMSWKTLRESLIDKPNVEEAIAEVIDILRNEGKPVQLRISEGNRVMEVLSTEVRND